jgi:hypothetical protein
LQVCGHQPVCVPCLEDRGTPSAPGQGPRRINASGDLLPLPVPYAPELGRPFVL